jgi:hypothetical protein
MIQHGLAGDDFVLVVPFEGQRIFAVWTFVFDLFYLREVSHFNKFIKTGSRVAAGLLPAAVAKDNPNRALWHCHWPSAWL